MGLLSGVLRSLDTVPTTANLLSGFSSGMIRVIKLVVERVGVMS